jgi:signal transduction histidine kinase
MNKNRERQRIQALFADLERLASDPSSHSQQFRQEVEALRTRIVELETQFLENEKRNEGPNRQAPTSTGNAAGQRGESKILYEKDQIGYAYANDKLETLKDSSLTLPGSQNAFTTKFALDEQAIGEMQMEPADDQTFSEDEISLAQAVLQQASLQIQNLRLLSATNRARSAAEIATRRFMHEGWDSYLDAIQRNERIGFTYDQSSVSPFPDALHVNGGVHAPVKVMDEQVGALYIEPDPTRTLTDAEMQLVNAVADQVAQQVENIRLLADASRARAEAEEAIRRLTRANWDKFTAERDELGFVYDSLNVISLEGSSLPDDVVLSQPLIVRGETVGQLAIAGWKTISPQAADLAAAIATQASIHLETLRLSEELQKRAKELEELDRLKSAFLANMSHELRTPLNSILGFTDVMLEGLDGDLSQYMDNDLRLIQKNGQHLLHLINDVLDMAKIESGRMNLHPEKFKVHNILDEVTSITSTLASEKDLSLFIDEESDQEIEIYADNTRLRQVMINLVNNSIKFTEKGKISICTKPMDGGRVMITVKDTGIGIPSDKLEAIFQEFTQVDTSTTRKVGGTGLGLPISRRLVEMHGGRLWAESTGVEGEGSIFYVELPVEARITEVIEKQEK